MELQAAGKLKAQLLHFLVVVLAVQDVPLLATFEDSALLILDLLARSLIDLFFLVQQVFQNFANFETYRVAIFDEIDIVHLGQGVGYDMRGLVYFVPAQPQSCTSVEVR